VPKVSVVIPTLNRARVLAQTIDRIETQTVSRDVYEVIVVDNSSADDTNFVLEEKSRQYANLKSLFQPKPGAAPTRNAGLGKASGEIVLFIDDDIFAEPELIEKHLEYHSVYPDASIIGSVVTPWNGRPDPFLRYLRHRGIYNPYTLASGPMDFSYYHTGNVSTRRSMLQQAGGFNEEFFIYGMEDIELGYRLQRLGCRMIHGEKARGVHQYCPTYEEFIERCQQAGYSLGKLIDLHPELKKRFVENGRWTWLLKRFHFLYRFCSYATEWVSRWLARRETQRGTGPISKSLELHYYWSVRYHFFLGYSQYCHHARNGSVLNNVVLFGHRPVSDFAMERVHGGKRSPVP